MGDAKINVAVLEHIMSDEFPNDELPKIAQALRAMWTAFHEDPFLRQVRCTDSTCDFAACMAWRALQAFDFAVPA